MHHFLEVSDRLRTNGVGDAAEEVDLVFAIDAAAWADGDGGVDVGGEEIPFCVRPGAVDRRQISCVVLDESGKVDGSEVQTNSD